MDARQYEMFSQSQSEFEERMRNDLVVRGLKFTVETLFGSLWILLILVLALTAKDIVWILCRGFKNEGEKRAYRHLTERQTQFSVFFLSVIVSMITVVLFRHADMCRRMLSQGAVLFALGAVVYRFVLVPSWKKLAIDQEYIRHLEQQAQTDDLPEPTAHIELTDAADEQSRLVSRPGQSTEETTGAKNRAAGKKSKKNKKSQPAGADSN